METIKVLLFSSNPRGTAPLDFPREFREITEEVRLGTYRDALDIILVPGARPLDLLRKLNEKRPQIVHFSSHGNADEIVLETDENTDERSDPASNSTRSADERDVLVGAAIAESGHSNAGQGRPRPISKSALVEVLSSCNEGNLRVVVLNACDTKAHAQPLTKVVDCVVTMNRAITDRAAIKFAASFYGALAFGRSVQMAFHQGVARLHAEGIAEADIPELLVREGVDASKVVLMGQPSAAGASPLSAPETAFVVPFPRNTDFVGRDDDLARLHSTLSSPGPGPVGIRPAGLTGMGGIGKTQLAIEYVYRHKADYPGGIYWIDAAGPLAEGFARLAADSRLCWAKSDRPRDEQIRAAFAELNRRPGALLVLDNLPEPATLAIPLQADCVPEDLRCRLLFTTRRHDLGRFDGVEVTVLPEDTALQLLLRHRSRRPALDSSHPDHEHARAVARMLGRLPLALELAGAYLGKFSSDVSLADYRAGLSCDGALATLDADAADLTEADLRRVHGPAVAATIGEQWNALKDESARLLLRVAALFPESAALPIPRLGMLAGLDEEARPGRLSSLRRAVKQLENACLIEKLDGDQVRLHPLILEFAARHTTPDQLDDFRRACLERAAEAVERFTALESMVTRRGVETFQSDLIIILGLCPANDSVPRARLHAVLQLLRREAHLLRVKDPRVWPFVFAQQVRNRAFLLGITELRKGAELRLSTLGNHRFLLLWQASQESQALIRTLAGHGDWVSSVAVTPDGRLGLSASFDTTVKVWDLASGQLLRTIARDHHRVTSVAVTPEGRLALSAYSDGTIKVWVPGSGQELMTLAGHEDRVNSVAVSDDGKLALSASSDRMVKLWNLASGHEMCSLSGHTDGVNSVAMSPDVRLALSGSSGRAVRYWDLASREALATLIGHTDRVNSVAVTPDGRLGLSASSDRTLRIWELTVNRPTRILRGHKDSVNAVTVTAEGRLALSASSDGTVKVWDLAHSRMLRTLSAHSGVVTSVAATADGRMALSGSSDGTVKVWDLSISEDQGSTAGHQGQVNSVAVTTDGRLALSASSDHTVKIWDLATGREVLTLTGHEFWVKSVAVTGDGRLALSASSDGTVKVWDLMSGKLLRTLANHAGGVNSVAVTHDVHLAISGSSDGTVRVWDLESGRYLRMLGAHPGSVWSVAVLSDNRHVISASSDSSVKIWDITTGEELRSLTGHTGSVNSLAVARDALLVLSASSDRSIRIWDLKTGQLAGALMGHTMGVRSVAVTSDGHFAISASTDRTLKLWDVQSAQCLGTFPLDPSPVCLALAPNGTTVVVGDAAGNVCALEWVRPG